MFHEWNSIFLICQKFDVLIDETSKSKCTKLMIKNSLKVRRNKIKASRNYHK
ncbi:hypothetical protein BCN_2755 [Bacillus cereus NC7401]|nr:hypothetical protein BCN_2755 [Bacillus cereus NC7401]